MDALRLRYLHAMRIPVWLSRTTQSPEPVPSPGLHVGPGSAAVLLVCEEAAHSATALGADLARAVGGAPAWAWPEEGAGEQLADAVRERLLTGVAVFGADLAQRLFGDRPPTSLGTARVVILPATDELRTDPQARRRCWSLLCEAGLASRR